MDSSKKISDLFAKKKKGPELSSNEKNAKVSVLQDLQARASKAMSSKLKGIKSNPEGDATELSHSPFSDIADHEPLHEKESTPEAEEMELLPESHPEINNLGMDSEGKPVDEMNEDEVDHHIQKLMAHKAKFKGNK